MQYLLLIYNDDTLLEALPDGEADAMMRHCFAGADAMKAQGQLLQSQQLEPAASARTVRIRDGRVSVSDGPFAETREMLGGFNLIEADSLEEAIEIASRFPWASTGCVEVRAIRDMDAVRRQVGAPPAP
ncbi:MAG TPA: YciI family protein [Stenotrophomonas sp.]|nr:YciI family protein [Stenotrophomonas sp.]